MRPALISAGNASAIVENVEDHNGFNEAGTDQCRKSSRSSTPANYDAASMRPALISAGNNPNVSRSVDCPFGFNEAGTDQCRKWILRL